MLIVLLIVLFLIIFGIFGYMFVIAFVRSNKNVPECVDLSGNESLAKYSGFVKQGVDYINQQPHRWVFTTSFDRLKLAARYYNRNSDKTVLLFHGYRSSATHDFSCAVKLYCEMGYNVLLVDQRSHGKSEGKLITFGVKESKDVLTWINFLNARYGEKKLILSGISMGASTVLLSLGEDLPENVKGIISDCGFSSPHEIIKSVAKKNFKINVSPILPVIDILCKVLGGFSVMKASTVDAVKHNNIPILFIHGESDDFVPCEMTRATYEAAGDNCRILTVPGAGHGMSFLTQREAVTEKIESFLSACLE